MMSSSAKTHSGPGSVRELFRYDGAAAILMDYDGEKTARFLRVGEFVINLIMQEVLQKSPSCILMSVCVLGELQWPLARDAPVFRVGLRTFVFAMPGLLYGIQFPPSCSTDVMDTLERVFIKFGHYKNLHESGAGYNFQENEPNFWQRIRPGIEAVAHRTLSQLGHIPGRRRTPSSTALTAIGFRYSGVLRVLRTSATSRMIGGAIQSGSLKATQINICNPKSLIIRKQKTFDDDEPTYYASINVFTDLIDAVEIAWMVAFGDWSDHNLLEKKPNVGLVDHILKGFKAWRWNKQGIVDCMKQLKSTEEE